jgi:4-hydroxybenzoate polyprenyltransferase
MLREMLKSMRPHQWYKNLVLFAGLVFAGELFVFPHLIKAFTAFLIFCLLSGAGYIFNDIIDRKIDFDHPEKSKRPVTSGKISVRYALMGALFICAAGNGAAFLVDYEFGLCTALYSVITVLYSKVLKNLVVIDVLTISVGFVIRAVAGAVVIHVYISPWLVLCAFMLALFLALCKRKQDTSGLYGPVFLDQLISIVTALVIMSYSLYTFLRAAQEMMVTIPLILYGLFRFLNISYGEEGPGRIELIFLDKGLLLTGVTWVLLVVLIVYVWEL